MIKFSEVLSDSISYELRLHLNKPYYWLLLVELGRTDANPSYFVHVKVVGHHHKDIKSYIFYLFFDQRDFSRPHGFCQSAGLPNMELRCLIARGNIADITWCSLRVLWRRF